MKFIKYLKNNQWSIYALIAIATLLIHIVFIAESNRSLPFQIPIVDSASYHNQAVNITKGITPEQKPFWQPPLYIYSLSFIYKNFSTNITSIRLIQGLFSILTVLLVFAIAQRYCSKRASILISLATALYGPLLFFSSQLLPTTMAVTGNMAFLLCWLKLADKPSWRLGLTTGLVSGITALLVSNILIFIPVLLFWIAWKIIRSEERTNWIITAANILLGLSITILPVSIRNYAVSKQHVLISTNAGINLYIGNNENPTETINIRPGIEWDRLVAMPYRNGANNETESSNFFKNKVITFAIEKPMLFINGLISKTHQLFNSREIPRNIDIYAITPYSRCLQILTWQIGSFSFPFGIVMPFALWGIVLALKKRAPQQILASFALLYSASIILFFPASRYIAPVMPLFIILAGIGLTSIFTPDRRQKQRITGAIFCLLFIVLLNLPIKLPTDNINYEAELHTNLGVGLQKRNHLNTAITEYKKSLSLNSNNADTYRFLATAYRASGNSTLAVDNFEKALAINPDHYHALHDLAIEKFQKGQTNEAITLLRHALKLEPENRHAMINLAIGLLEIKEKKEAEIWLKKASVMDENGINIEKLNAFRK